MELLFKEIQRFTQWWLCLLFLILFVITAISPINAQSILEKKVTIDVSNLPLSALLDSLSNQCQVQFSYDKNRIPVDKKISISVENTSLKTILSQLFSITNIQFKATNNYLILYREQLPYFTISGYIRDAESEEALIEANVFDTNYFRGSSSNDYGFYSLSLPEGKYVLKSTYVGYQERTDTVELYEDIVKNISLKVGSDLIEVVIIGNTNESADAASILANGSRHGERIDVEKAQSLPTFMGERDVLKYLQLLPGVVSGGLAGNNLYIRGGSLDQNLVLLDDVPIYNANHLFGLISVFNGAIVHSAKTYVEGFPARYGGRLSSIIDIRTKDGNKKNIHGGLSLGLFTATTYLEGPVQKEKSSFLFSARRTWLDLPLKGLNANPDIRFFDINAKEHFKLSSKDQLSLNFYVGQDALTENLAIESSRTHTELINTDWGNTAFSLRWNRILAKKLFLNTTFFQSNFHFDVDYFKALESEKKNITQFLYQSHIQQTAFKTDFTYLPNPKHYFRLGSRFNWLHNNVGTLARHFIISGIPKVGSPVQSMPTNAKQWTIYIEDEWQPNPRLLLHSGVHVDNYLVDDKTRWFPQFRFHLGYSFNPKHQLNIYYSNMMQIVHLLDNNSIESTANKWVIANADVPPATAQQLTTSFQMLALAGWKLKTSFYYKKMKNLQRFQVGKNIFNATNDWEEDIAQGIGKAYGVELLIAKITGQTQGWLTYTYSKSQRKFDDFEATNYFPYQFDRRHAINLTVTHSFATNPQKQRQISGVWTYAKGSWLTLPSQFLPSTNGIPLPHINKVNNFQLPAIHRLDLAYTSQKTTAKGNQHTWTVGIYNMYGQNNPYSAELQFMTPPNTYKLVGNHLSVTPIPYVTYGFCF